MQSCVIVVHSIHGKHSSRWKLGRDTLGGTTRRDRSRIMKETSSFIRRYTIVKPRPKFWISIGKQGHTFAFWYLVWNSSFLYGFAAGRRPIKVTLFWKWKNDSGGKKWSRSNEHELPRTWIKEGGGGGGYRFVYLHFSINPKVQNVLYACICSKLSFSFGFQVRRRCKEMCVKYDWQSGHFKILTYPCCMLWIKVTNFAATRC